MVSRRWGGRLRILLLVALVVAGGLSAVDGPAHGMTAGAAAASDDAAIGVKVLPDAPVQGDTLAVMVTAPRSAQVRVSFDGTGVPAYPLSGGTHRALIGTDPNVATGAHGVVVAVTARGKPALRMSRAVRIGSGQFGIRTITMSGKTFGLINPENATIERRALGSALGRRTPEALWSGPFVAPSGGTMDSPYGDASYYNGHRAWWHQGMDYAAAEGDPVVAANAGVVTLAQGLPLGGNTVVVDHGQGVFTEYLHLSAFTVRSGARVARGDVVGRIGATGLVTGPSLHWGLYVNGTWVNPSFWMEQRPGVTQ